MAKAKRSERKKPDTSGGKSKAQRLWQKRIDAANKVFETWETEFISDVLYRYFMGQQWDGDPEWRERVTHNLFSSTLGTKLPALLFGVPSVKAEPRPGRSDESGLAAERGKLVEDTVTTQLQDKSLNFQATVQLGALEAFFRFAVAEVGFSSDWTENPRVGKPMLNDKNEPIPDTVEPDRIVRKETLYVKRVPSKQFRVSATNSNLLANCDWCGYYEHVHIEDVQKNPKFDKVVVAKLKGGAVSQDDALTAPTNDEDQPEERMCKIWRIWDHRAKKRIVFVEEADDLLQTKDYENLPIKVLKYQERLDKFYPKPLTFDWKSLQDDYNQALQMCKIHRARAKRVYVSEDNENPEISKLKTCDDMSVLGIKPGTIEPLEYAALSQEIFRDLEKIKNDFREIAQSSPEAQGVAESDTATQSVILSRGQNTRDASLRKTIKEWLDEIVQAIFETDKKLALPFWVESNVDIPTLRTALKIGSVTQSIKSVAECARVKRIWQEIQSEDLEDLNLDLSIEVTSMSPAIAAEQNSKFLLAIQFLSTPATMSLISKSDVLLRKALKAFDIVAENDIKEIQTALGLAVQEVAMNQLAGPGAGAIAAQGGAQGPSAELGAGSQGVPQPVEQVPQPTPQGAVNG